MVKGYNFDFHLILDFRCITSLVSGLSSVSRINLSVGAWTKPEGPARDPHTYWLLVPTPCAQQRLLTLATFTPLAPNS